MEPFSGILLLLGDDLVPFFLVNGGFCLSGDFVTAGGLIVSFPFDGNGTDNFVGSLNATISMTNPVVTGTLGDTTCSGGVEEASAVAVAIGSAVAVLFSLGRLVTPATSSFKVFLFLAMLLPPLL